MPTHLEDYHLSIDHGCCFLLETASSVQGVASYALFWVQYPFELLQTHEIHWTQWKPPQNAKNMARIFPGKRRKFPGKQRKFPDIPGLQFLSSGDLCFHELLKDVKRCFRSCSLELAGLSMQHHYRQGCGSTWWVLEGSIWSPAIFGQHPWNIMEPSFIRRCRGNSWKRQKFL